MVTMIADFTAGVECNIIMSEMAQLGVRKQEFESLKFYIYKQWVSLTHWQCDRLVVVITFLSRKKEVIPKVKAFVKISFLK